jgi:hypothetical protein
VWGDPQETRSALTLSDSHIHSTGSADDSLPPAKIVTVSRGAITGNLLVNEDPTSGVSLSVVAGDLQGVAVTGNVLQGIQTQLPARRNVPALLTNWEVFNEVLPPPSVG